MSCGLSFYVLRMRVLRGCYVEGMCFSWFLYERCVFFLGFYVLRVRVRVGFYLLRVCIFSVFQRGCSQSLATSWLSCMWILTN